MSLIQRIPWAAIGVLLAAVVTALPARAQTPAPPSGPSIAPAASPDEVEELRRQVRALTERLEQLEKRQGQSAPAIPVEKLAERVDQLEKKQLEIPPALLGDSGGLGNIVEKKPAKPELQTIYDEGFWFVGPDDKLKIGGSGQFDYRWFMPDNYAGDNTFVARRMRLYATGVLEKKWGYNLTTRFDQFAANIHFAWLESQHLPWLRFRMGLFKEPFSLEGLHSDAYWDFTERSMITSNLLPLEDLGAMVYGKVWGDRIEYGLGAFNGRGRAGADTNDDKNITARIVLTPFKTYDSPWLKNLNLGVSGSVGEMDENISGTTYRTQAGTALWTFAGTAAAPVRFGGDLRRFGADVEYIVGPASLKAERTQVRMDNINRTLAGVNTSENLDADGYYVQASYLLTGEDKPRNRPVVPLHEFDPEAGGWGAFEVAARFEGFNLDDDVLDRGLAAGTEGATAWTIGLNWYQNRHMKFALDFEHVDFENRILVGTDTEDSENVLLTRWQFEF